MMSRIWGALPLLDPMDPNAPAVPLNACWWRHPLPRNEDGHELIFRTDATSDIHAARLGCWEWFDGLDEQLILGVDVFRVAHSYLGIGATVYGRPANASDGIVKSGPTWCHSLGSVRFRHAGDRVGTSTARTSMYERPDSYTG
ncbi:hypothetical protein SEA_ZOMBIE_54 [Mycobacterium phage Zombie]|nr:hypothetical protein SEA_ZOMBIE_54 [Mycobacterium phage Zombie]